MKVMKKILCVFFAALILCMPVVRTYHAHAVAVAASTLAAYAVLGTALTACGIIIASQDVPVTDALAAAWDQTTDHIKTDIQNIKLVATAAGGLAAHWTADKWGRFTRWVKNTFHPGEDNSIPLPASVSFSDSCLTQVSLDIASIPRIDVITGRDLTNFNYPLNSDSGASLKLDWDSSGNLYALLSVATSVIFSSTANSQIYRTMSGNFPSISVFQPTICGSLYVFCASKYQATPASLTSSNILKAQLSTWKFGAGCGNSSFVGKKLVMEDGVLKAGAGGTRILGSWSSIAQYIGACLDAGVVIGIPLDDGSTVEQDDVINPSSDSVPVSIDVDYYPDIGSSAAETDLPDAIGYDIPIPVSEPYTGQDVYTKDVTDGSIDIDFPRIGELNPSDVRPRVRTDEQVTARDTYMTTARTIEIPSELDDQTIAQPPPDGGGGGDDDPDDGNNYKLPALILTKFPFCIPGDLKRAVEQLRADPAPPKFNFHLKVDSLHLDAIIPVDFSSFESIAYFVRWLLSAFWVFILIRATLRILDSI